MIFYAVMDNESRIICEDEPIVCDTLDEAIQVSQEIEYSCVWKIRCVKGKPMKILEKMYDTKIM